MDDGGFSSFFREAYPRMVGQLRLLTGDLASAEDIARTSHAHPTLAEAVREAALAVAKRSIHS